MITFEEQVNEAIKLALAEDLSGGDATTDALVPEDLKGQAVILIKGEGVLAGIEIARQVFRQIDQAVEMEVLIKDGSRVGKGDIAARVKGRLAGILKAERTALNFLQRLSGIASETARYVAAVQGLPVQILDTRKTTPGLRLLEKYAVRMGGGQNHRLNLSDAFLIKDNHLEVIYSEGLDIKAAVKKARSSKKGLKVEVETRTLEEVEQAAASGADIILLDNMKPQMMKESVKNIAVRARTEASGNISLRNIRAAAETGVDFISIGALTHSVRSLDISLEYEPV